MPEAVAEQAEKELRRLERQGEQSPESSMIRSYLDWLIAVPWSKRSEERLDPVAHPRGARRRPRRPRRREAADHRVHRRAQAARGARQVEDDSRANGAILTLVGPPGTGKTSIGESIARALGREFVRISLGGLHDEAEIRGHRRTYIGALPGRIVRALRDAETMNPVILLDEVDKVGADWRGDPSAALLEVLDPAQNHSFRDHYLDVEVDLSEVVFIATANLVDTIPAPLLDRMEIDRLRRLHDRGEAGDRPRLPAAAAAEAQRAASRRRSRSATRSCAAVISEYTREAGVRQLERELGKLLRGAATKIASGEAEGTDRARRRGAARGARPPELLPGVGRAHGDPGRLHRPGGDRHRRRRPLHRGDRDGRRQGPGPDRPARRRDEGVGADRALLRALAPRGARHRAGGVSSASSTSTSPPGRSPRTAPAPARR